MKLSDARLAELEADAENGEYIDWNDVGYLLEEVRSSRAALARIASAYNDPGSHPDYHERVKRFTRRDWPTLTAAIEAAIGKENHGR